MAAALILEHFSVELAGRARRAVLQDCSLEVRAGRILALVGESGSGKTTLLRAMAGLLPPRWRSSGSISWREGESRLELDSPRSWRRLRGAGLGWIAQEPAAALNPRLSAADHIRECWRAHRQRDRGRAGAAIGEALEAVGLPECRSRDYPFQWSGGMQQRLLIAMALVQRPRILLADELTSALDTGTQRQLLELLGTLRRERGLGVCLATHDLAMAAACADEFAAIHAGRIVELGAAGALAVPRQAHTAFLAGRQLPSPPRIESIAPVKPAAAPATPVLDLHGVQARFGSRVAVADVSLTLAASRTLALVGPSGAGKSTIGRLALGLLPPTQGRVCVEGQPLELLSESALRRFRARMQIVFQDPQRSLDPAMRVDQIVTEGLEIQGRAPRGWARRRWRREQAATWLERVGLAADMAERRPGELSGGEKQRVAIARAMALEPALLVADEPLAALDTATGAAILELMAALQRTHGTAILWISHQLSQAAWIADQIAVVESGRIVEAGPTRQILAHPRHDCTRNLLAAAPPWPPLPGRAAVAAPEGGRGALKEAGP